jgi:two-component system OmpR family sensor kinase
MGALQKRAEVAEAMNRIESEAIRMGELVESLLTLARLDEGNRSDTNQVDLIALARSTAKDASVAAGGREVAVIDLLGIPVMPKAELFIEADSNKIRQVLTNLLANANRFSPDDAKIEVAVGVPLGSQSGIVQIEIRDRGEGIPVELREKVFERFFRADSSRNRETGGSGLGLAIVKAIVERHGGTIVADETPGGGATFKIELPIAQS